MPLDAICLAAVRGELAGRIIGMKIDKVQQPERDVIILSLRGGAGPCKLLISAGAGDARVHLTEHRFENPASPPMFCMLLRKHLTGAKITEVYQPPSERVLDIVLSAPDSMGVFSEKRLTTELIGRVSNIILTGSDGIIIDCLRRIGGEMTDRRSVLPGLLYRPPPAQIGKLDPMRVSVAEWKERFREMATGTSLEKWLLSAFSALSPLISRELLWRAYGTTDKCVDQINDGGKSLFDEFFKLTTLVKSGGFEPFLIVDKSDAPCDFSYLRILQYESAYELIRLDSFSELLDVFYTRSAHLHRLKQRTAATFKTVKTSRDRIKRKLAAQREELNKTAERDRLRKLGDIITANLHMMKKGQKSLAAHDFYSDDNRELIIDLDPLKTPQQNAAKYYKEYTKARNAEKFLTEQISHGESELEYLESVMGSLALAEGERDLIDIRRELAQTGYIKAVTAGKIKMAESLPLRFESSSGFQILAGRNNIQNDKLTLKTAAKTDLWLHTQKIHGCHVIIRCGGEQPDETTLYEAAAIAAYYSAARFGGKVPVDYTLVRYVKRRPGSRPGMVIYTDYKTIAASPDEKLVMRLRQNSE